MRRASVLAALIVSVFAVQSASAAVIGVRGGDAGSEDIRNGSAFELSECDLTGDDDRQFYCVVYENLSGEDVYLLEAAYWNENRQPILVESLGLSDQSEFVRFLVDDYLVRFCSDETCDDPDNEFAFVILSGSFFRMFTDFKGYVSIQTWNGTANLNAAIPGQPIPEPATLLLLGLGVATVAGRRLRTRRQ